MKRANQTAAAITNMNRLVKAYAETLSPAELLNLSASLATGVRELMTSALPYSANPASARNTVVVLAQAEVSRLLNREAVSMLGLDPMEGLPAFVDESGPFATMLEDLATQVLAALDEDMRP